LLVTNLFLSSRDDMRNASNAVRKTFTVSHKTNYSVSVVYFHTAMCKQNLTFNILKKNFFYICCCVLHFILTNKKQNITSALMCIKNLTLLCKRFSSFAPYSRVVAYFPSITINEQQQKQNITMPFYFFRKTKNYAHEN